MERAPALFSRRVMLGAGAALGLAGPSLTLAYGLQTASPPPSPQATDLQPPEDLSPEVLALLPNLVTRLAARVMIDGAGPFEFVVDTGANRTAISRSLATRLNLPPGPAVVVHGVTSADPVATVTLGQLQVAGTTFSDLHAPVFPDDRLRVAGLLGLDVLGRFRLNFNMAARTLSMGPPGFRIGRAERNSRISSESIVRAERRFGQLVFASVEADGARAEGFLDSGGQYTLGNRALLRAIDARSSGAVAERWGVPIVGLTGARRLGELAVIRSLRLGSILLRNTPVVFADLHAFDYLDLSRAPALLIGADIMGRIDHVTMDFAAGQVLFGRPIG